MITRPLRPFWTAGITWALVCLIGMWLPPNRLLIAVGVSGACFVAGIVIKPLRSRRDILLIALVIAVAAALLWHTEVLRYQPVAEAVGSDVSLTIAIRSERSAYVVAGDLPKGVPLQLSEAAIQQLWQPGDVVQGVFNIDSKDLHGFSLLQAKAYGTWCEIIPTEVADITAHRSTVRLWLVEWRKSIASEINRVLPQDTGAVVAGICLGEDGLLSLNALRNFRACGVTHLFAVSGLHLSILTQALLAVLKRLRIPRRLRGAFGAVAVLGFVTLMDFTASVTRAGVLCLLVMLGECFRRQADARNSMGLALLLLLASEPFAVYDAGLLLSFLATCGILFLSKPITEWLCGLPMWRFVQKPWQAVSPVLAVTLSASITTLPITMVYFGSFSVMGIVANPVVTLPATVILVLGWITILPISLRLEWLYRPLLLVLGFLARGVLYITSALGSVDASSLSMTVWFVGSIGLIYGGYRLFRYRGVCITSIVSAGLFCVTSFLL